MKIIKNLVSTSKYNIKCPYSMNAEFIVVHNTANDASAKNEIAYMIGNNNQVSFHYAIDDKEIVQGIPENRNTWNAGDGGSGKGNRKGLSIEICYSKSGGNKFIEAEKLAAKFIAFKLKEKGWDISKVMKHQDFSKKYCPHRTLDMGWQRFLNMVQSELNLLNKPSTGSSTEKILYRVQTGAFSKKSNADALLAKVKAAGFDTYMVQSKDGLYKVQVGAYSVKSNADAMAKKLKAKGFNVYITTESGSPVTSSPAPKKTLKVGSKVKVKPGAKTYTGGNLSSFVYNTVYDVIQISGNRVVIGKVKAVTAAIHKDNLLVQ
ncbi:MAG: N-acetylmuramoyl-L-alanine amidase [Tissierellia bacterium]|nr:N-acetylmuramoyl-L-alanine amidase [Tissierellia bacterium]